MWHCQFFMRDFMEALSKFGRIPYTSVIEPLEENKQANDEISQLRSLLLKKNVNQVLLDENKTLKKDANQANEKVTQLSDENSLLRAEIKALKKDANQVPQQQNQG